MDDQRKKEPTDGFGDDQGTRVGSPDESAPRQHSDGPSSRPERQTGAGSEATEGLDDEQHRSGYGGAGGKPVTSSDEREDRREQ